MKTFCLQYSGLFWDQHLVFMTKRLLLPPLCAMFHTHIHSSLLTYLVSNVCGGKVTNKNLKFVCEFILWETRMKLKLFTQTQMQVSSQNNSVFHSCKKIVLLVPTDIPHSRHVLSNILKREFTIFNSKPVLLYVEPQKIKQNSEEKTFATNSSN